MPHYSFSDKGFNIWKIAPAVTLPNERRLQALLSEYSETSIIVDIGSGGRSLGPHVITFDKFIQHNTTVIGDIHSLPFSDNSLDCIVCTGTLEHVDSPQDAVGEFLRVLKPGGKAFIATPFMQGYHPDPMDFWRFTPEGLALLMHNFEEVDSGVIMGPGSGLSWAINDTFRSISDNRYISEGLGLIARFAFFWVKYLDVVLRNRINSRLFASGYYFIGMKPHARQTARNI